MVMVQRAEGSSIDGSEANADVHRPNPTNGLLRPRGNGALKASVHGKTDDSSVSPINPRLSLPSRPLS